MFKDCKISRNKRQKFIDDYEKVTNIIKYTEEQQWRDPHF